MKKAPIPNSEEQRLRKLRSYNILDTEEELVFDEITTAAATICDTPISLISLVDEARQWFKSRFGLDIEETPRDISFCGHAIMSDEVFVVEDATKENDFCDNPFVTEGLEIRFYAGAPLITPEGLRVGTLCLIDSVPKTMNESQKLMLRTLAKQVINYLELNLKNKSLEKTQKQYEEVQTITNAGYWELDLATGDTIWSKQIYEIYGIEPNTLMNKIDGISYYAEYEQERLAKMIENSIVNKVPFVGEFDFEDSQGVKKIVRSKGYPVFNNKDEPVQLIGTFQDISNLASAVMRERELFEQSRDAILTFDQSGTKLTSANQAALNLFKIKSLAEFVKVKLSDLSPKLQSSGLPSREQAQIYFKEAMENGRASFEFEYLDLESKHLYCDVLLSKVSIANESFVQATIRDITKQRETEKEHLYTLNSMKVGTWKWDIIGNELEWNESNYNVFHIRSKDFSGAYEAWEKTLHPDFKQEVVANLQNILNDPRKDVYEATFPVLANNETFYVGAKAQIIRDDSGNATRMFGINWDKTDEYLTSLELEEQKRLAYHNAKLASIGTLAASVGHEINNPMAIIRGHVSVMDSMISKDNIDLTKFKSSIEKIDNAVERAARIVRGLKSFSRNTEETFDYFDLNLLVQETMEMFKDLYKKELIEFQLDLPEHSAGYGDSGKLQQVLINLITNAKDSLEGQKDKIINITIKENENRFDVFVNDTGKGIPHNILPNIFDPFFTSKDVNKGTGIGLAICHKIIKEHGYELKARNLTVGAELSFSIPKAIVEDSKNSQILPIQEKNQLNKSSQGKILIVDDEEDLRDLLEMFVQNLGFEVVTAKDGKDAIEKYLNQPDSFQAIITDLKMPKLSGRDVVQTIYNSDKSNAPKIFILSGDIETSQNNPELAKIVEGFIPKPFQLADLEKYLKNLKN